MKKSKVMHLEIKSLLDEFQKFFNDHCKGGEGMRGSIAEQKL